MSGTKRTHKNSQQKTQNTTVLTPFFFSGGLWSLSRSSACFNSEVHQNVSLRISFSYSTLVVYIYFFFCRSLCAITTVSICSHFSVHFITDPCFASKQHREKKRILLLLTPPYIKLTCGAKSTLSNSSCHASLANSDFKVYLTENG